MEMIFDLTATPSQNLKKLESIEALRPLPLLVTSGQKSRFFLSKSAYIQLHPLSQDYNTVNVLNFHA